MASAGQHEVPHAPRKFPMATGTFPYLAIFRFALLWLCPIE
jgi:hypothetical protein